MDYEEIECVNGEKNEGRDGVVSSGLGRERDNWRRTFTVRVVPTWKLW